MNARVFIILAIALAVFGAVLGFKSVKDQKIAAYMRSAVPPPPTISTAIAKAETWTDTLNAVATLRGLQGITVSTDYSGTVSKIAFTSGSEVKAGDLLVQLDTSVDEAQLAGLEASAQLAATTLQRTRQLRENGTNTQADLDFAEATHKQAVAAVEQLRAVIAKKHIVAPFAGRVGIRQVDVGQHVDPGTPLVILEAIDQLYADFGVPQREAASLDVGRRVSLAVNTFPQRKFEGVIEAINPRITDETRTLRTRAVLKNADGVLKPGMFGQIAVELADAHPVVSVPATAITFSSYGDYVYVVAKDPKVGTLVHQRFVTTSAHKGDLIAVSKGLAVGDEVVTTGQIKLRNGIPVSINNSVVPDANAEPKPEEK